MEHFIKLGIAPEIIEALSAQGYTQPTPIQEQAIPAALAQNDILGTAQTGTGKTAAFSIPIIQQLMGDAGRTKGIKASISPVVTTDRLNNSIFFSWLTDLEHKDEDTSHP